MCTTEVIDRAYQIHASCHGCLTPSAAPCTPTQDRQAAAERAIQPLDIGSVEHLTARRAPQQRQKYLNASLHQSMQRARHRPPRILFDHLCARQVGPPNQPRTSTRTHLARSKGFAHRIDVCHQSIADTQQWPQLSAGCDKSDQTPNQRTIPMGTDCTTQPQPCADHHRQCHPHDTSLGLDVDLVRLYLHQIAWPHDLGVMEGFGLCASSINPGAYGLGLEFKGHLNRWKRTARCGPRLGATICPLTISKLAISESVPWRLYSNSRRSSNPGCIGLVVAIRSSA